MFEVGWSEIALIAAVAILVIGPKELPEVMRGLGRIVRRLQYVRYAFTQQFEDYLKLNDLDKAPSDVNFEAPVIRSEEEFDEAEGDLALNPPKDKQSKDPMSSA